jgi:hypothetical protein
MDTKLNSKSKPDNSQYKVIPCKFCNEPFKQKTKWQLFCRPKCRNDYWSSVKEKLVDEVYENRADNSNQKESKQ